MVKLTPELIAQAAQVTNPIRDRELNLRGLKIAVIENLGSTLDQFDTIDFSDNDIRKVDGFPLLRRLKCLLLNNNRITRICDHLEANLPNLESLVLTNNNLQELGDIDCLAGVKNLTSLSLLRNPLSGKKHYRLYIIHRLPQLRLLDFRKIRLHEKEAAANLFKGKRGLQLAREIGKRAKTFVPGGDLPASVASAAAAKDEAIDGIPVAIVLPQKQDVEAIRAAIAAASTLEEVERLNRMLQSGLVPSKDSVPSGNGTLGRGLKDHNGIDAEVEGDEETMET